MHTIKTLGGWCVLLQVLLAIEAITWLPDCELWIEFRHGKHLRYIPAHRIAASLGQDSSRVLPFFHALSRCDTTSCFKSIGNKTTWDTWRVYPDVAQDFIKLSLLKMIFQLPRDLLFSWTNIYHLCWKWMRQGCNYLHREEGRLTTFPQPRQL